ncbi:MAG: nucleotide sugar dehydrogenase [Acidobacteriota bacterium]|nr:MAG: nucleotide sugar dehydrogenase [Acidobacteriota bacterium]
MGEPHLVGQLKQALLDKISVRSARVGVVGLGYVGLPLAEVFARAGFPVTGFDVEAGKIAMIEAGRTYIEDLTHDQIAAQVQSGRLRATTDFDGLTSMDVVVICVPTPLRKTLDPDISYVVTAAGEIRQRLRPGQLVVLESTTYPGTTDEVIQPLLEESGLRGGRDFFLAFSPERVDPSNPVFKTENTPKVVGGTSPACNEVAAAFYEAAIPQVHNVSSARSAEMVKLLENTFRLINIGLVNEFALICERLGLDVWEIIEAAATKPFGFMPFYPGPGLGGHCIPIDPHYLSWKLRSLNYFTRFIDLASEINRGMPAHVVRKLGALLNERRKPLNGSKVLLVGVAYKKNTGDTRESPALDVALLLHERGAELSYHDPHVPSFALDGEAVPSMPLSRETIAAQDAVLIITDHAGADYQAIVDHAALVFDTRNATRPFAHASANVVYL